MKELRLIKFKYSNANSVLTEFILMNIELSPDILLNDLGRMLLMSGGKDIPVDSEKVMEEAKKKFNIWFEINYKVISPDIKLLSIEIIELLTIKIIETLYESSR